ncbi:hypothetical protein DSECCO2_534880 [anaerobic digester metagenome]
MFECDADLSDDLLLPRCADQFRERELDLVRRADDDQVAGLPHLLAPGDESGDLCLHVLLRVLEPGVLCPDILVPNGSPVLPLEEVCEDRVLTDPLLPALLEEPSRRRVERGQAQALPEVVVTDERVFADTLADGIRGAEDLLERPLAHDQGALHLGAPAASCAEELPTARVKVVDAEVLVSVEYLRGEQEFHDAEDVTRTRFAGHIYEQTYWRAISISVAQRVVTSHPSSVTIRVCSA